MHLYGTLNVPLNRVVPQVVHHTQTGSMVDIATLWNELTQLYQLHDATNIQRLGVRVVDTELNFYTDLGDLQPDAVRPGAGGREEVVAYVFGTASSDEFMRRCLSLGTDNLLAQALAVPVPLLTDYEFD